MATLVIPVLAAHGTKANVIANLPGQGDGAIAITTDTFQFGVYYGGTVYFFSPGSAGPTTLFDHYADVGNGTTVETTLYDDTIAGGTLGANGDKLTATYGGVFVSSATATREVRLYFGGTVIFDTGTLTLSLSAAWALSVTIIRKDASTVRYVVSFTTEGAALSAYTAVGELGSLTLSASNHLKVTGQATGIGAATNDVVAKLGTVSKVPAA